MPDQVRHDICQPGCYGPAYEGPLERVAEDPARVGYNKGCPLPSGLDKLGGAGAEARGRLSPFYKKHYSNLE